jgi:D-tyrosyl-tRNA(Tyr) deacylase
MRLVVQRVLEASVRANVAGEWRQFGTTGRGFLILLGVGCGDSEAEAQGLADRTAHLRVFEGEYGKMNRSLIDVGGTALVVSNFTLYADCRKGRRPSFSEAASGPLAEILYLAFGNALADQGIRVEYGLFGAEMRVSLINDGPVTLLLDSRKLF